MAKTTKKEIEKEEKNTEQVLDSSDAVISDDVITSDELTTSEDDKKKSGPEKYYEAVGRRKEATARVRVLTKKASDESFGDDRALITVNGTPYFEYFKTANLHNIVESPLRKLKSLSRFKATVKVNGGGVTGQADAIKHGLSRALILFDPNFGKKLSKSGYLTRDARVKERRKYGLKKSRKAPQWSKR